MNRTEFMKKKRRARRRRRFFSWLILVGIIYGLYKIDFDKLLPSKEVEAQQIEDSLKLMGEESMVNLIFKSNEFLK